jgi:hypothetical protein
VVTSQPVTTYFAENYLGRGQMAPQLPLWIAQSISTLKVQRSVDEFVVTSLPLRQGMLFFQGGPSRWRRMLDQNALEPRQRNAVFMNYPAL